MKHTLLSLLLIGSFGVCSNAVASDRHDDRGYYDTYHKDYHRWNAEEERRYHEYLRAKHRRDHEWRQASRREQQEYWIWRHQHWSR